MSLLNAESPDVYSLFDQAGINLLWHPSLSESSAEQVLDLLNDILQDKIHLDALCLEGSVMRGPNGSGRFHILADSGLPTMHWIRNLAQKASFTAAIGSCAAFGGITAAGNNPGCPTHPNWVAETLIQMAIGDFSLEDMDHFNRPRSYTDHLVHHGCPRNEFYEYKASAVNHADQGCMMENLGCLGTQAHADCNTRLWNGSGSCLRGGYACINCTAPGFEESGHIFSETPKIAGIPIGLPTDMPKAWFVALASLSKAATPKRLRENAVADHIVVSPMREPNNGRLASNIILATENLADHLTHFYLFFMPDFARDHYQQHRWYQPIATRFRAQTGTASREMLRARANFLYINGILAGKWPHTLAILPGGTSRSVEPQERVRLLSILAEFRHFLETTLFDCSLDSVLALEDQQQLEQWADQHPAADFAQFLQLSRDLNLIQSGRSGDRFMSFGCYDQADKPFFDAGVWDRGLTLLNESLISEDISNSWMMGQNFARHPYEGSTLPDSDINSGYSWCKAPRLGGRVMEVGALARQQINGNPLIRDLVSHDGGNVNSRIVARVFEVALLVVEMQRWILALKPREVFCVQQAIPDEAQGAGMIEAARGSLGHWLRIKHGRIFNYQIIAPTTWNFSPRDASSTPGALEQALVGTVVGEEARSDVAIQHIVRSFDPCMVCTVH